MPGQLIPGGRLPWAVRSSTVMAMSKPLRGLVGGLGLHGAGLPAAVRPTRYVMSRCLLGVKFMFAQTLPAQAYYCMMPISQGAAALAPC